MCEKCTLPQMVMWNHTIDISYTKKYALSLQRIVQEIYLKVSASTTCSVVLEYVNDRSDDIYVFTKTDHEPGYQSGLDSLLNMAKVFAYPYVKTELVSQNKLVEESEIYMYTRRMKNCTCKSTRGYNKHVYMIMLQNIFYIFVKYMSTKISFTTEYSQNFKHNAWYTVFAIYNNTYPFCPDKSHFLKLFSWIEADKFCKDCQNHRLP